MPSWSRVDTAILSHVAETINEVRRLGRPAPWLRDLKPMVETLPRFKSGIMLSQAGGNLPPKEATAINQMLSHLTETYPHVAEDINKITLVNRIIPGSAEALELRSPGGGYYGGLATPQVGGTNIILNIEGARNALASRMQTRRLHTTAFNIEGYHHPEGMVTNLAHEFGHAISFQATNALGSRTAEEFERNEEAVRRHLIEPAFRRHTPGLFAEQGGYNTRAVAALIQSRYASDNPHELWAEAFALHTVGRASPEVSRAVEEAVENMSSARSGLKPKSLASRLYARNTYNSSRHLYGA